MINGYKSSNNIILNISETKNYQKELKKSRWKSYDIKIIKEYDSELDRLHEVLAKRHAKREIRLNRFERD